MITRAEVKQKSEELNIPFANLLPGVVCEAIVDILFQSAYKDELYLCNGSQLNASYYNNFVVNELYFDFYKDIDSKLDPLYFKDILKLIISKAAAEALAVKGQLQENGIRLTVTVSDMYVPIFLHFSRKKSHVEGEKLTLSLTMYSNRIIDCQASSKEEALVRCLTQIISKLELINDMDCYFDAYEILTSCPVNGRHVKARLEESLIENDIKITKSRINILGTYGNYTYMKKKWKVALRQKKKSEPQWSDLFQCLFSFIEPIWHAMETNQVFLGDWMPQLKRYLD